MTQGAGGTWAGPALGARARQPSPWLWPPVPSQSGGGKPAVWDRKRLSPHGFCLFLKATLKSETCRKLRQARDPGGGSEDLLFYPEESTGPNEARAGSRLRGQRSVLRPLATGASWLCKREKGWEGWGRHACPPVEPGCHMPSVSWLLTSEESPLVFPVIKLGNCTVPSRGSRSVPSVPR